MHFTCETVNGSPKIKLDISDVELEGKDKLQPYLLFTAGTYKNIKDYENDPEAFDHIFCAPNVVLRNMSNENRVKLIHFFASVNYTIHESIPKRNSEFLTFIETLGQQYLEVATQINLLEEFRKYAAVIALQDTSSFGTRPQDTEELTFKESEMRETMVLAMFCKMATPIFGELINNLPEEIDAETGKKRQPRYKESRCSGFMTALITAYFPDLINKLQGYILHIVNSWCAKQEDAAATFHGLTVHVRTSIILSSLLVRNYVLCELEKPESNIMRYTDTMVRTLTQTQDTNAHKSQVRTRKAPGSMMSGDDSGHTAQMEVDSLVSSGTMDGPIIIEASIDRIVQDYRLDYNITLDEFQKCLDFFKENPIYCTPLNKFVTCSVFGLDIGGGKGIEEIGALAYTKLVAILQLIAFNMGYIELGNMLTASKSDRVNVVLNTVQDRFKRQAPTLPHYRSLRASFAAGDEHEKFQDYKKSIREAQWDAQMEGLLNDLATSVFLTNTPDVILDTVREGEEHPLNEYIHNGTQLDPTVECTEEMCALVAAFSEGRQ